MEALRLFQEYMGTGLIMIWFLVSLLYLWITEKRKHIRIMFLYVPLLLLLIFFNPFVSQGLPAKATKYGNKSLRPPDWTPDATQTG